MATPHSRYEFDISGWHCNAKTKAFATKAATFLSDFMAYLMKTVRSETRLRRLASGAWEAGQLICRRGFYDRFSPSLFGDPEAILLLHRRNSCDPPSKELADVCDFLADYAAIAEHRSGPAVSNARRPRTGRTSPTAKR
jgi:hypothetical protein